MAKNYQPSECIGTRLRRLSRTVDDLYRKHLHSSGVSESQLSILLHLWEQGATTQANLGRALHLQRSTVTRNLQRLFEAGVIEKPGDDQRAPLGLTKKGKSLVRKLMPLWQAVMDEVSTLLGSSGQAAIGVLERRLLSSPD